jgi:predicted Fe-Mo cluster-binding NifX family protein
MKIAFTAGGPNWDSLIDPLLGRTEFIVVYDDNTNELDSIDNRAAKNEVHGAGTVTAQKLLELKPDVLITGNGPGGHANAALRHLKLKIFVDAHGMTLREAYENFTKGNLKEL